MSVFRHFWLFAPLFVAGQAHSAVVYNPIPPTQPTDSDVLVSPATGHYRLAFTHISDFALDADKNMDPLANYGEHRIRLDPSLTWQGLKFVFSIELLSGQIFGDHEDIAPLTGRRDRRDYDAGLDIERILPRSAYVQWTSKVGMIKAGLMTSHFGLGLAANNGRDSDEFTFGMTHSGGDVVIRALLATTPFHALSNDSGWGRYLTMLVSGDAIYQDDNAELREGDRGYNVTAALMYRHPDFDNGFLYNYRYQKDRDADHLIAHAFDLNGRNTFALGQGKPSPDAPNATSAKLHFDYEIVALFGHTDRYVNFGAPDGLNIQSFAAVGRLWAELDPIGLDIITEVGFASGDDNSNDDMSTAFSFDPDYEVGLIFFDEFLPRISARGVEQAMDPTVVSQPVKGVGMAATQGKVTNAVYLMPTIRYTSKRCPKSTARVQALVGGLAIWSHEYLAQTWYTNDNGGVATNQFGRTTDSHLIGGEALAGLRVDFAPVGEHLGLALEVQHAWFLPGPALADPEGNLPDPVWKVLTAATVSWR